MDRVTVRAALRRTVRRKLLPVAGRAAMKKNAAPVCGAAFGSTLVSRMCGGAGFATGAKNLLNKFVPRA
jgi:hypothetical protein